MAKRLVQCRLPRPLVDAVDGRVTDGAAKDRTQAIETALYEWLERNPKGLTERERNLLETAAMTPSRPSWA